MLMLTSLLEEFFVIAILIYEKKKKNSHTGKTKGQRKKKNPESAATCWEQTCINSHNTLTRL